ncbi:F0F1 ATP synthase subunit B [Proteobacteria bacterium 005FR1]|nr:F0F1 ATP synthase subunit B [Proteobacteria bacterium 005FR1]
MNINLTLIGQSIAFIFFVLFCMKFVWPPIVAALAEREKKIADGLLAAERAEKDLELAKHKVSDQLREAKEESAKLIEQANKRAQQIVEEAKQKAIEEADRQKAAAEAEIAQQMNRAREELRGKVATLAIAGAERILQSSVDQQAHGKLVDDLAAQL